FCLTRDKYAFISQHIGDMENAETLEHFEETVKIYCRLFRIKPELIACDMHPDYLPVRWAENRAKADGLPLIRVQHHHAHVVSCMAENSISSPVIGVAMDGTGYGTDGCIWGGEFLIADYKSFQRAAHLEYLPLPGGEAAIARPYRTAIGYLYRLFGDGLPFSTWFKEVSPAEIDLIMQQVNK
ncbi:MAG: carbamoyltransferase HypF, partial [Dehalococcoidales bacterium]|nr:carbamoyltransferase HypF [Dehalococcoidales bacterium]